MREWTRCAADSRLSGMMNERSSSGLSAGTSKSLCGMWRDELTGKENFPFVVPPSGRYFPRVRSVLLLSRIEIECFPVVWRTKSVGCAIGLDDWNTVHRMNINTTFWLGQ